MDRTLPAAEQRAYRDDGFFVRESAFSEAEVEDLRAAAERVAALAAEATIRGDGYAIDGNRYVEAAESTVQFEHRPDSGTITVDGKPLDEISITAWRGMVGYVPQELSLLHGTVRTNISMGDDSISDKRIVAALKRAGGASLMSDLPRGLDTDVGEMGLKLSGGQRQRISLARALVLQPKLLILDEVTSALDPQTEQQICNGVSELAGPHTIVVITHRPAWVDVATELYTIERGVVSTGKVTVEA